MTNLVASVAELIGLSTQSCKRIAASAHFRYKIFSIPKRNGRGVRVVAQPAKEVKAVQRALVEILTPDLPVHDAATAYKPGTSILSNATMHAQARFLTKLDFVDFFPSISAGTVARHIRAHISGITDEDVTFVLDACLWRPQGLHCLCTGAPSSPLLSNSVMFDFDVAANQECEGLGVVYSRYSDDISVSATEPDKLRLAEDILRRLGERSEYPVLRFNDQKRVAVGRGAAMRVTGLTLANNGSITVGRARKRGVRAGAYKFIRNLLNADQVEKLKGEIAFVLSVEPDFRSVLVDSYGVGVVTLLPRLRFDDLAD